MAEQQEIAEDDYGDSFEEEVVSDVEVSHIINTTATIGSASDSLGVSEAFDGKPIEQQLPSPAADYSQDFNTSGLDEEDAAQQNNPATGNQNVSNRDFTADRRIQHLQSSPPAVTAAAEVSQSLTYDDEEEGDIDYSEEPLPSSIQQTYIAAEPLPAADDAGITASQEPASDDASQSRWTPSTSFDNRHSQQESVSPAIQSNSSPAETLPAPQEEPASSTYEWDAEYDKYFDSNSPSRRQSVGASAAALVQQSDSLPAPLAVIRPESRRGSRGSTGSMQQAGIRRSSSISASRDLQEQTSAALPTLHQHQDSTAAAPDPPPAATASSEAYSRPSSRCLSNISAGTAPGAFAPATAPVPAPAAAPRSEPSSKRSSLSGIKSSAVTSAAGSMPSRELSNAWANQTPPPALKLSPTATGTRLSSRRASLDNQPSPHSTTAISSSYSPNSSQWAPQQLPRSPNSTTGSTAHSRPASGGRQRPGSAASPPVRKSSAKQHEIWHIPPQHWAVPQVCAWLEHIGMGQYRHRFLHHCISGQLLLALTDRQLKTELLVGPLGHRVALLDGIKALAASTHAGDGQQGEEWDEDGFVYEDDGHDEWEVRESAPGWNGMHGSSSLVHGRPGSAPVDGPRRPASAHTPGVIPPDSYLGPATGRITVFEQQARIVFELDRAHARVQQLRGGVHAASETARIAEVEVARLQGLLVDLRSRHKLQIGASRNSLDMGALVPWHHVGNGTRADMSSPPRRPQTAGSTPYQGPDFLSRLQADLRKRELNKGELARKYYGDTGGDFAATAKQASSDLAFVQEFITRVFGTSLSDSPEQHDQEIDDILESYAKELKLDGPKNKGRLEGAKRLRGARKLAALAGAIRAIQFMERYEADRKAKPGRTKELAKQLHVQEMGVSPQVKEQKDLELCEEHFHTLGWRDEGSDNSVATDELLGALLRRAKAYKEEYEKAHDKAAAGGGGAHDVKVAINWDMPPWSSDGLASRMAREKERLEKAAAAGGDKKAKPAGAVVAAPGGNEMMHDVMLLARLRVQDLSHLAELSGKAKRLAVFRSIRTRRFVEFTETDLKVREEKAKAVWAALQREPKVVPKEQMDAFYKRLQEDAEGREARLKQLQEEARAKEAKALAEAAARSRSRPRSTRR